MYSHRKCITVSYLNHTKRVPVRILQNDIIGILWIIPLFSACAEVQQTFHFLLLIFSKEIHVMSFGFRRTDK